jgi:hypothetical protein
MPEIHRRKMLVPGALAVLVAGCSGTGILAT